MLARGSPPMIGSMMRDVVIRTALVSEQAGLEALQRRASLGNPGDREALLANPAAIELPLEQLQAGHVFVAEVAGSPAGVAALVFRPDGDAELDAMFVEPDLRRRGLGTLLIDHCAVVARGAGSRALHVIGNPHARAFYSSSGFDIIGTTQTRFGPGLLMRRLISPSD